MAQVVSADEIKKTLANYSPDQAEVFHEESSRIADKQFDDAVANTPYKKIVLLSGGSASGKSEFLATQLMRIKGVILDATLSTRAHAEERLEQIIQAGKTPVIYSVIPDDLKRAFVAFLGRDRKFSDDHFYRTHSKSRETLLWIATNYPNIHVTVIESSYTKSETLQFAQILFSSRKELITYLTNKQMTEDDIITYITS